MQKLGQNPQNNKKKKEVLKSNVNITARTQNKRIQFSNRKQTNKKSKTYTCSYFITAQKKAWKSFIRHQI